MQVATLFRETATLLGAATMEPASGQAACNSPKEHRLKLAAEPHDDGYETSADLMLIKSHDIKCEPLDDPYSFVDDEPAVSVPLPVPVMPHGIYTADTSGTLPDNGLVPVPRKRGRKKKIKLEPGQEFNAVLTGMPQPPIKERKKHDRFNGMPEEEVSKRTLPDHLTYNLDIIIIGINPGLFAAYKGHHYAGPGNHFWKCLYLSGLTPEQMTADEDYKLLQVGIGFTNMVQRATKGSADLTRKEIKEGSQILLEKLRRFKPKIAVFNGKLIYEVFSGKKDFSFGRQPDLIEGTNTYMWVMPSSSARCAQLPRAADKVPFYAALKKFRDYLNGMVASIDDSEVVFSDTKINKPCYESEFKSEYPSDIMDISNATVKKEDANGVFCKKKRGRPKKIRVEGEEPVKPVRRPANPNANLNSDGTKKKRGRPKKIKAEDKPPELEQTDSSTTVREHFSSPSQSPATFCTYAQPCAAYAQSPRPVSRAAYAQSPRPQSQPLTHSDLSSEISAAISSPAPTSPPPDFEPPASMPPEDSTECCFSSPAPSEPQYPQYNYGRPQDIAAKSLSGLESLVDQIPSIAEGGGGGGNGGEAGGPNDAPTDAYPPYHYGYGHYNYNYPGLFEHQACVPLAYPSYAQYGGAGGGYTPHNAPPAPLHAPSPNYPPYYNSHAAYQPVAAPATPATASYHMFDRIKPDSGYGGF